MLGSNRFPTLETNYAGVQGPRNCEPLLFAPPARIARSVPLWYTPRTSTFSLSSQPTKVAKLNVNRGVIAFGVVFSSPGFDSGGVNFGVSFDQLKAGGFTWTLSQAFSVGMSPGALTIRMDREFSYQHDGAKSFIEWWAAYWGAVTVASCYVTELEYYG